MCTTTTVTRYPDGTYAYAKGLEWCGVSFYSRRDGKYGRSVGIIWESRCQTPCPYTTHGTSLNTVLQSPVHHTTPFLRLPDFGGVGQVRIYPSIVPMVPTTTVLESYGRHDLPHSCHGGSFYPSTTLSVCVYYGLKIFVVSTNKKKTKMTKVQKRV